MKNRLVPVVSALMAGITLAYPALSQVTTQTAPVQVIMKAPAPAAVVTASTSPSATENLRNIKATLGAVQYNVTSTMAALNALKKAAKDKGGLEGPSADFMSQSQALEAQVNALKTQAADAKANIDAYFQNWQNSISSIQNKDIKETATDRLNTAKSRYGRAIGTADEARKKLQPFLADLKDVSTFVKVDLTADSVNSLSNTVWRMGRNAESAVDGIADVVKDIDITLESLPKN